MLIADGVGLGKTLEAAIQTTELEIRGRGRRILVRLDSAGIQRVRSRIPP